MELGEPTFENEKIRVWRSSGKDKSKEELEDLARKLDEEAGIRVDFDSEELYESRTYTLLQEAKGRLLQVLFKLSLQRRPGSEAAVSALEFLSGFGVKVLAKRNCETDLITFRVYLYTSLIRVPLLENIPSREQDNVTRAEYEATVKELEDWWKGTLAEPLITSAEEFRSYLEKIIAEEDDEDPDSGEER